MSQIKFPASGISGKLFLMLWLSILTIIFVTGLWIAPHFSIVVSTLDKIPKYLVELTIKLMIVTLLVGGQIHLLFWCVLDTPMKYLKGRFEKSRNDSHAILLAGLFLTGVLMVVKANGAGVDQFVFQIMTRGSMGYATGTLWTVFISRLFGVRSMDQFRDWMDAEDNDSYAIIVMALIVGSMALAMSV